METLTYPRALSLQPGATLRDAELPGLELTAKPRGKVWTLYYRYAGERRRPKLGEFPALKIEDAREAARAILRKVAQGVDPQAEARERRTAARMPDLWEMYYQHHALVRKKASSAASDLATWRRLIEPHFGKMAVRDVTLFDVNAWADKVSTVAPVGLIKYRALLSTLFNFAEHADVNMRAVNTNPVKHSKSARSHARRRKMERHEFEAIGAALRTVTPDKRRHVAAIVVMLMSGTRVTELVGAPRSAFDYGAQTLTLREHKTDRTGKARTIRLSRQAADMLDGLPIDPLGRLFGDLDRWKVGDVWRDATTAAGCSDLQLRDLRRTFASIAKSRGVSLDQIGELFSHASTQTTMGYAYLFADSADKAVQETADAMQILLEGPKL